MLPVLVVPALDSWLPLLPVELYWLLTLATASSVGKWPERALLVSSRATSRVNSASRTEGC